MAATPNEVPPLGPVDEMVVAPTSQDRGWAAAVHLASIPWPVVAPAVACVAFRRRAYVAGHARRALLEAIVFKAALLIAFLASAIYTTVRLVNYFQANWEGFSWQEFVLRFVLGWILVALLGLANTALSVWQAWKAWKGPEPAVTKV